MGKIVKNGVTYSGSSDNADNVKYNNNVSNLDATNVQEAIDKLDESVDILNSNLTQVQSQIVPTASIESGATASKAYSKGDFLVKNGSLYKVTKAIAKDDTLTVGTNIELDTVASELSSISERLSQMSQSEYKIKEYVFKYTNVNNWMAYNIDEPNAFLDGSSYLDTTNQYRYMLAYGTGVYCRISYKDGAEKFELWSQFAGTAHIFVRYK